MSDSIDQFAADNLMTKTQAIRTLILAGLRADKDK